MLYPHHVLDASRFFGPTYDLPLSVFIIEPVAAPQLRRVELERAVGGWRRCFAGHVCGRALGVILGAPKHARRWVPRAPYTLIRQNEDGGLGSATATGSSPPVGATCDVSP